MANSFFQHSDIEENVTRRQGIFVYNAQILNLSIFADVLLYRVKGKFFPEHGAEVEEIFVI